MITRRSLGTFALLVFVAGCDPSLGSLSLCFCGPAVPYAVTPEVRHVLVGDTATFFAYACSQEAMICGLEPNAPSNWTVTADAARVVSPDGLTTTLAQNAAVVVRGVASGSSSIIGVALAGTGQDTVRVIVADSSVIATIDMRQGHPSLDTLRLGMTRVLPARMKDASGTEYYAVPSEWTVSDTTVVTLGPYLATFGGIGLRIATPKRAGTVTVETRFRDVVGSVQLTVVP